MLQVGTLAHRGHALIALSGPVGVALVDDALYPQAHATITGQIPASHLHDALATHPGVGLFLDCSTRGPRLSMTEGITLELLPWGEHGTVEWSGPQLRHAVDPCDWEVITASVDNDTTMWLPLSCGAARASAIRIGVRPPVPPSDPLPEYLPHHASAPHTIEAEAETDASSDEVIDAGDITPRPAPKHALNVPDFNKEIPPRPEVTPINRAHADLSAMLDDDPDLSDKTLTIAQLAELRRQRAEKETAEHAATADQEAHQALHSEESAELTTPPETAGQNELPVRQTPHEEAPQAESERPNEHAHNQGMPRERYTGAAVNKDKAPHSLSFSPPQAVEPDPHPLVSPKDVPPTPPEEQPILAPTLASLSAPHTPLPAEAHTTPSLSPVVTSPPTGPNSLYAQIFGVEPTQAQGGAQPPQPAQPAAPFTAPANGQPTMSDHMPGSPARNARGPQNSRTWASPQAPTQLPPSGGIAYLLRGGLKPVAIRGAVVIGREPNPQAISGTVDAQIYAVPSPTAEISRSHCALIFSQGTWVLLDLGSRNGTFIQRANGQHEHLASGLSTSIHNGDIIGLGDGVNVEFHIQ